MKSITVKMDKTCQEPWGQSIGILKYIGSDLPGFWSGSTGSIQQIYQFFD